jgi:hypothetical protein
MPSTYTLISSNVLGSSAASVTFSAIPATFTDLVLRVSARKDTAGTNSGFVYIQFNSDTGTSPTIYSGTVVRAYLATVVDSARNSSDWGIRTNWRVDSAGNTANTFDSEEIYIPNYLSTTSKPIGISFVSEDNTTNRAGVGAAAGLYRNTSAITSILMSCGGGENFVSGSSFYLYGISKN